MPPTLTKVVRLDSLPIVSTYYTEEGYLKDRPVLTSTGIFEYRNPDGTYRRELRLPEEVFAEESLKSYKGKPIIITHDAGIVTKENVGDFQIGTVLSEGYRNGDDVRAEIIIHQTDEMRRCGLKELSLGYDLDLEETAGEWNGMPYDAIQRNIRINHLALVREARAGDQARLNIDSRDSKTILKGGKAMSKKNTTNTRRADGLLSPEELTKAIEEYMSRRAASAEDAPVATDGDNVEEGAAVPTPAEKAADGDTVDPVESAETVEEKVQIIKDRKDSDTAPETVEEATDAIARKDGDISILCDIIDTLLAERDFGKNTDEDPEGTVAKDGNDEGCNTDSDDEGANATKAEEEGGNTDEDEDKEEPKAAPAPATEKSMKTSMNADAIDAVVRERIQIGMLGRTVNLDGLENMSIKDAKKAIILAVRPSARFDGKSDAYVSAMYDLAVADIRARDVKDTAYQRKQMFTKESRADSAQEDVPSAISARQRMIERRQNKEAK